jgi:hypothetical protein
VLSRSDSGFDSARLLFQRDDEKRAWAAAGRRFYAKHGAHEQFHSEIKTDLDLERLPSGKFDCHDLLLLLGMFAYNCLRLIGQPGLTGELVPVCHPAKRRRLKTVLQELMYRAAQFIRLARQRFLDFGWACPVGAVFRAVQADLLTAGRSP